MICRVLRFCCPGFKNKFKWEEMVLNRNCAKSGADVVLEESLCTFYCWGLWPCRGHSDLHRALESRACYWQPDHLVRITAEGQVQLCAWQTTLCDIIHNQLIDRSATTSSLVMGAWLGLWVVQIVLLHSLHQGCGGHWEKGVCSRAPLGTCLMFRNSPFCLFPLLWQT